MYKIIFLAFLTLGANLFAETQQTTATGIVQQSIDVADPADFTFAGSIDIVDKTATNTATTSFVVKANADDTDYSIWYTVASSNYADAGDTGQIYALSGTNKLPVKLRIIGITSNTSGLGTGDAGSGISIDAYVGALDNTKPTSADGQTSGYAVNGTDLVGTTYTMEIVIDTDAIGTGDYINIPDGTYSIIVTTNVVIES